MCIAGSGSITLDGDRHDMRATDCLYILRGIRIPS